MVRDLRRERRDPGPPQWSSRNGVFRSTFEVAVVKLIRFPGYPPKPVCFWGPSGSALGLAGLAMVAGAFVLYRRRNPIIG